MPNDCQNYLHITHKDAREIGRAKLAILDEKLFQEFHPCPQELINTVSGHLCGEEQIALEAKMAANRETYGVANWYEWCLANWSTKWDAYDIELIAEHYDNDLAELMLTFDTAWSPPIAFYNELMKQGFTVTAMYNEFGCQFCGMYYNGSDNYVEYSTDSLDEIDDDVDEQFGIRDAFAEQEE